MQLIVIWVKKIMQKYSFYLSLMFFGLMFTGSAYAGDTEELSNIAFLSAHEIKEVYIGNSLNTPCPAFKTCTSASFTQVFNAASSYFQQSAAQVFSRKTMQFIENSSLQLSVAYDKDITHFGMSASF